MSMTMISSKSKPQVKFQHGGRLFSKAKVTVSQLWIEAEILQKKCVKTAVLLPERDYVTFGSLLSQFRLSSVCRLSVTLVHPTQGVEPFGKISSPLCTLAIL